MSQQLPRVTITTDGGCEPNPGAGAWAAILRHGNTIKTLSGVNAATTNNRMELTAIAEALEALKKPCRVKLRTDSQIAVHAICVGLMLPTCKRRQKWERRGKNMDLVRRIWAQLLVHWVTPIWVKGHAGDHDNEACDKICSQAMRGARS
jgi:ribonuclease HI